MEPYVRVLIRRPHAYDFLREHPDVVPQDAVTTRADGSLEVDDSKLPIPSICVLDASGAVRAVVPLNAEHARQRLLDALRAEAR
jgi:hypothetical protein